MNPLIHSLRRVGSVLVLAASLLSSCAGPAPSPEADSLGPSNLYLTMYASSFVDVLRAGGTRAGAFEMDRRSGADGLHHLRVELWGALEGEDRAQQLDVGLIERDSGLSMVNAQLDELEVFPASSWYGSTLLESQRHADRLARNEVGEAPVSVSQLELDVSTHWLRFVRLDDLDTSEEPGEYDDLRFRTDGKYPTISAVYHRNLMRLGVGSEEAFLRLAGELDWTSEHLTQAVDAAGIELDEESNTDYWSPLFAVPIPAGTAFAVRSRLSSLPTALVYIQASERDAIRLLIARSPLPTESN